MLEGSNEDDDTSQVRHSYSLTRYNFELLKLYVDF